MGDDAVRFKGIIWAMPGLLSNEIRPTINSFVSLRIGPGKRPIPRGGRGSGKSCKAFHFAWEFV
jgi:hypothetical protein